MNRITKAVIPGTGLGARLKPLTYGVPKELLIIKNKTLIHYVIEECISAGEIQE